MSVAPRLDYISSGSYAGMRLSAAQFFRLPDDGARYELVDGVVVVSPSPTPEHNNSGGEVYFQLRGFLKVNPVGTAFYETDVHLGKGRTGRDIVYRPDVMFFRKTRLHRTPNKPIAGVPDLVVEVISPSSERFDLQTKFEDYERLGVVEYWVLDQLNDRMTFYRSVRGKLVVVRPRGRRFKSLAVPGFELDLAGVRKAFRL